MLDSEVKETIKSIEDFFSDKPIDVNKLHDTLVQYARRIQNMIIALDCQKKCQAKQCSDMMSCVCGLSWDMNDAYPPECPVEKDAA